MVAFLFVSYLPLPPPPSSFFPGSVDRKGKSRDRERTPRKQIPRTDVFGNGEERKQIPNTVVLGKGDERDQIPNTVVFGKEVERDQTLNTVIFGKGAERTESVVLESKAADRETELDVRGESKIVETEKSERPSVRGKSKLTEREREKSERLSMHGESKIAERGVRGDSKACESKRETRLEDPEGHRKRRGPHVPGAKVVDLPAGSLLVRGRAVLSRAVDAASRLQRFLRPNNELFEPPAPEEVSARTFSVPLMDICLVDAPLVKRVPGSQAGMFAQVWGRLLEKAVASKLVGDWSDFFIFPKCILWVPVRGGTRMAKKACFADMVRARLARWPSDVDGLWEDVVQRSPKRRAGEGAPSVSRLKSEPKSVPSESKKASEQKSKESAVISALRLGDVRKALQVLNSAPIAPKTPETLERLRKLHPVGEKPEPVPQAFEMPYITEDVVRSSLSTFGPGSAAGLFGYKPLLLQQCARAESYSFCRALTSAMNHFATGDAPSFLKRFIAGGVSIALEKSATAVRPLACGDPLRRLVAKCFCVMGKSDISRAFAGRNFGVGCKGGVEVVAHSLRDTLEQHKDSGMGLLKIDFRNAFNEVNRNHFMKATCSMFPALSAWTEWCYGEQSMLLYDHQFIIESMCGVQGDPLGPLYFCCGITAS